MKKYAHTAQLAIAFILIIGICRYLSIHRHEMMQLKSENSYAIAALFFAHFCNYLLLGHSHNLMLKLNQIKIHFHEWFGLSIITDLFNYALPAKGGVLLRMYYLKKNYLLPYHIFLGTTSILVWAGLSLYGLISGMYFLVFWKDFYLSRNIMILAHFSLGFSFIAFVLLFSKISKHTSKFQFLNLSEIIRKNEFYEYLICFSFLILLYPIKIYFQFKIVGLELSFSDLISVSFLLFTISLFPILPGNLGVKEIATGFIAQRFGLSFEAAILASVLDRLILSFFLIPFGLIYYMRFFHNQKRLLNPLKNLIRI